jgi:CHAT domain-containing protein
MVEFRQFRRTVYDNHPELAVQSADFEPAGPDKLSALLPGAKTALLDYFFVRSGVVLFVVREAAPGAQVHISTYFLPDPKHTLSAEARKFREQLASRDLDYRPAARQLFNRLLAPAMAELRGTTDWIISPDGALWDIPFEALVDPAGRHVIESRAVALTPSLTAALEIHQRARPAGKDGVRLLAFGNPLPSPTPLPDAAREVEDISANYPRGSSLVRTGASATAAEFRDKAPSAQIIHLAAHAGLNDSDPLSSFIGLGNGGKGSGEDGVVTALDIMSLHLRADMVVLSACETALGSTGPGEGMIGMGWALSAAGASSSVLSLWKVDSAASREFMTSFYRNLAVGGSAVSRSGALRQTGLEMLQLTAYRHPFYWAAFTLWGDGFSSDSRVAGR